MSSRSLIKTHPILRLQIAETKELTFQIAETGTLQLCGCTHACQFIIFMERAALTAFTRSKFLALEGGLFRNARKYLSYSRK
ncbi:hypothetical protein LPU83_pLPU83c_0755 (plasmid) [Rhizobium favelukesii]|uniref:Uncharacterized protein n=1 Tax=Rhizobium favelukesii TaxID=348824 RepID=W6RJG4_9HYPH|nr:hypothetical protein LPU83_pLPU83c_0755 [Rhizobium favelukesii]